MGVIVLLIFSAWRLNAQFTGLQTQVTSLQTEIASLEAQNNELRKQISKFENETDSFESQNDELVGYVGKFTEQLALARPIQVEIVSLVRASSGNSFGGLLQGYSFNLTIRNNDVVTVSGIVLTLNVYFGDKLVGYIPYINKCLEIDLLIPGEERVISFVYVVSLEFVGAWRAKPLTYVTTLESGEVILDQLTET